MVFVYVTCKNTEEAKKIAYALIEQKAAGCVNIFPVQSIYNIKGEVKEWDEASLMIKTLDHKTQDVIDIVKGMHSYRMPCTVSFVSTRINPEGKTWIAGCIG